jgi:hypothetical protein
MAHFYIARATSEFPVELAALTMCLVSLIARPIAKPSRLLTDAKPERDVLRSF